MVQRLQKAMRSRKAQFERLETRQLLAADLMSRLPNKSLDVNRDGSVTPVEVRSIDGSGNNLKHPHWGSTDEAFLRDVESAYADGISQPSGSERPSARTISNLVIEQSESLPNDRNLSGFLYIWGQFIDHDLDLTAGGTEAFNIAVPEGDAHFDPMATGEMEIPFKRSQFAEGSGTDSNNPAEQVNQITAFLDGSMIYGSSQTVADSLRSFEGGRLLVSAGELLPLDTSGNFFIAGDIRVNENPNLTAMQTLWVREHNWQASKQAQRHPNWNDERIFQAARRIVIAELQAITYNEFLPALMGRNALSRYQGYDPEVNPGISTLFSTVAFRFGHSTLNSEIGFVDQETGVTEAVSLADAFFNPGLIKEYGIDAFFAAAAEEIAQEIDPYVVEELRSFLFGPPGAGGLDLPALNIQRGRDHGISDYNSLRTQLGLQPAESFADITDDPVIQQRLAEAYRTVNEIDPWVGALAEDHVRGGSLGELAQSIVRDQFERTRAGDRLWYQNIFKGSELQKLESTTLADVIKRNTVLSELTGNVFFTNLSNQKQSAATRPPHPLPPPQSTPNGVLSLRESETKRAEKRIEPTRPEPAPLTAKRTPGSASPTSLGSKAAVGPSRTMNDSHKVKPTQARTPTNLLITMETL